MLTVANNAFTFELFPTVSRGITIALCSTSGKVGAIIAPYIAAMVRNLEIFLFNVVLQIFREYLIAMYSLGCGKS
jgi:hypothetical protein